MHREALLSATLAQPLAEGADVAYCASFARAWGELTERFGRLTMTPQPALADGLNEPLAEGVIDPASCVARAGFGGEGILEQVRAEIAARFDDQRADLLPASIADDALFAYALFARALPFRTAFSPRTTTFAGRSVAAFGVSGSGPAEAARRAQVIVHDALTPKDFVLELVPEADGDAILVAQMARPASLDAAIARVLARRGTLEGAAGALGEGESLAVPCLAVDASATYQDILRKPLQNEGARGRHFDDARQTLRLTLDESGAVVRSEAALLSFGPPKRAFHVTEPFLLMLLRRGASAPYVAAWVATSAWMKDRGEAPRAPIGWG